jgi:predicted NBD/HSP70 family sugar kinase
MKKIFFEEDKNLSEKARRNLAILEILRRWGPISRPDISQKLGLNVVTISNYIDDFIKHNFVYERELDISEGGRRPVLLDLNARAGLALGVGLNLMNMVAVLVDLKGNILSKAQIDRPAASVREIAESILEIIRQLLRRSKEYVDRIEGIGIGIAGLVNKRDGSIHWPEKINRSYAYASVSIPLKDLIEREFSLPTIIENDATCACLAEQWFDLNPGIENIIYMFSGVGAGLMLNGQIYTGTHGYAGEMAIHNYKEDHLLNCSLGNPCFLKRWEIDMGITQYVKDRLAEGVPEAKELFGILDNKHEEVNLKSLLSSRCIRNVLVQQALELAAQRLGIKIASLVNLLNPQVVVIGGGFEEAGEEFLVKVRQAVREWAFREMRDDLQIVYSQLRENAVAQGAATLVIRSLFVHLLEKRD